MDAKTAQETVAARLSSLLQAQANCRASGNTEWLEKHGARVADLLNGAPSGSGFDCGSALVEGTPSNRLIFTTSFHHMDEHGGYDGWTEHKVTVRPTFTGLDVHVSGHNRNEIKDYIAETFLAWLESPADSCVLNDPR